jgi:hypothetical protein
MRTKKIDQFAQGRQQMRGTLLATAFLAALTAGGAQVHAGTVTIPYSGSFNEASVPAEGGFPAGDYDTIGGGPDVGLFNLVAGSNTFLGSVKTPNDSSDAFVIGISAGQTLTGASIVFGTNLTLFNPLFAAPAPIWTLEESSVTPTIFLQSLGFRGMDAPLSLSAPAFTRGAGIYSFLIGNGTFATNNNDPVQYAITFTVSQLTATTPIPASLPLFASGLAAMGFLGFRRRRQAGPDSSGDAQRQTAA